MACDALRRASALIVKSNSISFEGHGTYGDVGLWEDAQTEALARVANIVSFFGAVPGVELGHAGRKAGLQRAFDGYGFLSEADKASGEVPWEIVGPSAIPFADGAQVPIELSDDQLGAIADDWPQRSEPPGPASRLWGPTPRTAIC